MAERDIYIAIMVAAAKGRGVMLSADEVYSLSLDDAISTRAQNGLGADEEGVPWRRIAVHRDREPNNRNVD